MFFIIFGSQGVTSTRERGQFHCPGCDERRSYAHKRVRRFFTLYFIPLIPLDLLGEYIECNSCKGTYDLVVLEYDPAVAGAKLEAQFERAVKRTMVMMMMADGVVDAEEIKTIREVYANVMDRELPEEAVRDEIRKAKQSHRSLTEQLSQLAGGLNSEGKEIVLKAAFLVAMADGELHDDEKQLLVNIGEALQMTQAHMRGAVDSLREAE